MVQAGHSRGQRHSVVVCFFFFNSHSCVIDSWAQNTKHESFRNREAWQEPRSGSRNVSLQFDEWNVSPWGSSCGQSGWTSPSSFFPPLQATYVLLALAWVFVPVYISSGVGWFAHAHTLKPTHTHTPVCLLRLVQQVHVGASRLLENSPAGC